MTNFIRNFPIVKNGVLYNSNKPQHDVARGVSITRSKKNIYLPDKLTYELDFNESTGASITDTHGGTVQSHYALDMTDDTSSFPPTNSGLIFDGNSLGLGENYAIYDTARSSVNETFVTSDLIFSAGEGSMYTWVYIEPQAGNRAIFVVASTTATSWINNIYYGFYVYDNVLTVKVTKQSPANIAKDYPAETIVAGGLYLLGVNSITGEYYVNNKRIVNETEGYQETHASNAVIYFLNDFADDYGTNIKILTHKQYTDESFSQQDFDNIYKAGPQKPQERLQL